eukprot:5056942-Alexandrium_andersonii.AAC.1
MIWYVFQTPDAQVTMLAAVRGATATATCTPHPPTRAIRACMNSGGGGESGTAGGHYGGCG